MSRFDMSELEWQFIKYVLPNKRRGVKRVDDRRVIARNRREGTKIHALVNGDGLPLRFLSDPGRGS